MVSIPQKLSVREVYALASRCRFGGTRSMFACRQVFGLPVVVLALVAQMAERVFGKDEVSGPIPDEGSKSKIY